MLEKFGSLLIIVAVFAAVPLGIWLDPHAYIIRSVIVIAIVGGGIVAAVVCVWPWRTAKR